MPAFIRRKKRWAIYLRDGCACAYCGTSLQDVLADPDAGVFLTLDHVRGRGEGNDPTNLVTACSACNNLKGTKTVSRFAKDLRVNRATLWGRVNARTRRPLEPYLEAAKVLLGDVPGLSPSEEALRHDLIVRAQWEPGNSDIRFSLASFERDDPTNPQENLWCPYCSSLTATNPGYRNSTPQDGDLEDIPF